MERHEADHGIVPVENSTDGIVTPTLDALLDTRLALCGETVLRISHCLLSQSGRLEDVKRVASHPQPLAQCRHWLDRHLPGGTAPSGSALHDLLYADSTAHRLKVINNNGTAENVVGSTETTTTGKCAQWSGDGTLIMASMPVEQELVVE